MKNTLNEADLRELFAQSSEVKMHTYASQQHSQTRSVLLIYCEGMADSMRIQQFILPQLEQMLNSSPSTPKGSAGVLMDLWPILPERRNELSTLVYSGQLILFFEEDSSLYTLDIANPPQRKPEESSTEVSIKGPRDAFTEEVSTNIALVRKRLRSPSMCTEQFIVGRRSHTKVALLYIRDIISSEIIDEVRSRIQALDIDALLSSSQLQELIGDTSYPLFPLMDDIGRPDYVADSLIRGRFAILVDGAPMALLAPSNLMEILKSPEDMHLPFHYVSLERLLRLIGLLISIYLPGFWIAVSSFNLDQIPFPLLATITSSRLGLPLSGPIDFYLIIGLFELFREVAL
ncbi:Spore germination protein XA [compost metagenome]